MMVKVLLYGYSTGVRSSRKMARACIDSVSFRVLAAGNQPDHRTVSDFRKIHLDRLSGLFVQVVQACKQAGLVKLGVVAIDGSKVRANANRKHNKKHADIKREHDALLERITRDLERDVELDEEEDRLYGPENRGDELPPGFRTRNERLQRLRKALDDVEREARQEADRQERKVDAYHKREVRSVLRANMHPVAGLPPKASDPAPDAEALRNTTDPDSRAMRTDNGLVQGYNAQAAVDVASGVIVSTMVVNDRNDKNKLTPMLENVRRDAGALPGKALADAGYWGAPDVEDAQALGVDVLVRPVLAGATRAALLDPSRPPPRGRIPRDATLTERMFRRLRTRHGKALYKKRSTSIEPVFGQVKTRQGFTQFSLRGEPKVDAEWRVVCACHNVLKLWSSGKWRRARVG